MWRVESDEVISRWVGFFFYISDNIMMRSIELPAGMLKMDRITNNNIYNLSAGLLDPDFCYKCEWGPNNPIVCDVYCDFEVAKNLI